MRAGVRVACAASLAVVVGVVSSVFTAWQAAMLVGWDAGVLLLIPWIWMAVAGLDAEESRTHATRHFVDAAGDGILTCTSIRSTNGSSLEEWPASRIWRVCGQKGEERHLDSLSVVKPQDGLAAKERNWAMRMPLTS
jgi:hypothetical protein